MQEMRRLCAHYSSFHPVWKILARPIESIMGYPDSDSLWVRCDDAELRASFWNMVAFLRHVSKQGREWKGLFRGSLLGALPIGKRLSGPGPRESAFWFSGDATMARAPRINWGNKEFVFFRSVIIADIELLAIVIAVVIWGIREKGVAHIVVADNRNAISWTNKKARRGVSPKLLETFLDG